MFYFMIKWSFTFGCGIIVWTWWLQRHDVPGDDFRLVAAKEIIQKAQQRNNWIHGTKKGIDQEQESAEDDSLHVNEEGGVPVEDHVESEPGQDEQENEHVATTI